LIVDFSGMSGKIGLLAVQGRSYCDLRTNLACNYSNRCSFGPVGFEIPEKKNFR
jgi:hypothetical protein